MVSFSQFTVNLTYNSLETLANSIKRQGKNLENLILTKKLNYDSKLKKKNQLFSFSRDLFPIAVKTFLISVIFKYLRDILNDFNKMLCVSFCQKVSRECV